jgi:glycosyltransferase involved in cell wall biosynthesis
MAQTGRPTAELTVCIAVKDREDDLRRALESLHAQTVLPRQIIIVDDGSAVPVVAERLSVPSEAELVVLRNEASIGAAKSYNRTVERASYGVVAFLDSDDMFLPTYVEKVSAYWERSDAELVCLGTSFLWCLDSMEPYRRQPKVGSITRAALVERGNYVGGCSVLSLRREMFLQAGGYPPVRGSYDWALMIELCRLGRIETIDEPLVLYRAPGVTTASTDTSKYMVQALAVARISRRWDAEERRLGRNVVLSSIAYNAAQAGRVRLSRRAMRMRRLIGGRTDGVAMRTAIINAVGPRFHAFLIRSMAKWRAMRFRADAR